MKMAKHRLWLHTELLRIIDALADEALTQPPQLDERGNPHEPTFVYAKNILSAAVVFDCRALPLDFVIDTGESICEEPRDVRGPVRLPFEACYFEFSNMVGVVAMTGDGISDLRYEDQLLPGFDRPVRIDAFDGDLNRPFAATAMFYNNPELPLFDFPGVPGPAVDERQQGERACKLVLGVLDLLNNKFLTEMLVPDPMPRLSKVRARKGKLPISSESRVLTVNVAAVRHAVSRSTPAVGHESPCLHWRRGHDRVLHRGSEFESKTWVRRCLVGDPARGYASKDYRLVWAPPMIPAAE